MKLQQLNSRPNQRGFAMLPVMLVAALLFGLAGFGGWRVYQSQNSKNLQSQAQANGRSLSDSRSTDLKEEQALQEKIATTKPKDISAPGNSSATTITTPPAPVKNTTSGTSQQTTNKPPASQSTTPVSNITRPTAEFCAQKNGNTFTNVWLTGSSSYTYQGYQWENGYSYSLPQVSKTETGTPLRNYDSMQIFDVLPYGSQPQWAHCSDKAGYIMYYYSVPNSAYVFNVLAAFEHVSLTQP
jgi:Tfp pilus assembly protein PilV